jgi:hypothetical protein
MIPRLSRVALRAKIYADEISEVAAHAHENLAEDLSALVEASLNHWRALPSAHSQPDRRLLFAGLADVLSDSLPGISSGHLQAIDDARETAR